MAFNKRHINAFYFTETPKLSLSYVCKSMAHLTQVHTCIKYGPFNTGAYKICTLLNVYKHQTRERIVREISNIFVNAP